MFSFGSFTWEQIIFGKWDKVRTNLPLPNGIYFIAALGKLFLSFTFKF